MFIQTEAGDQADRMKFLPGQAVCATGAPRFDNREDAAGSPLALRLLALDDVAAVEFGPDFVTVTRSADSDWLHIKPAVLGAIMDHFVAGLPVMDDPVAAPIGDDASGPQLDESDPVVAEIRELIETRVRPAATQGGGDVVLRGYEDGVVYLELQGPVVRLKSGIENMLRHYVPEVASVADWRDALPKPGLDTDEAKAIQEVLETRINPSIAGHGGSISLIDVTEDRVYIRMDGGCQGCGMANVTLKQGIEVEIKKVIPAIREVLDVTDHAGGTNPYYQSG